MLLRQMIFGALLTGSLATATGANATTVVFQYTSGSDVVGSGAFSFDNSKTGVVGYADLTSFTVTSQNHTYTLADVLLLDNYIYFGYDISANTFNSGNINGYQPSLSAIDQTYTSGFYFAALPAGVYREYHSNEATFDGTSFTVFEDTAAVPEPATWALMIGGFAMTGFAMRYRKTLLAV